MLQKPASTETILRFLVWGSLAFIALIDFVAIKWIGVKLIVNNDEITFFVGIFLCLPLSIFIHKLAKKSLSDGFNRFSFGFKTTAYFIELFTCFVLFVYLFLILSYLAAISPRRFYDTEFMAFDKSLEFDWLAYITWVNNNPIINEVLKFAYHSTFQIPILFLALAFMQKYQQLYSVMLSFIISVIIVIGISAIFPAVDPFTYLKVDANHYPNVYILPGYAYINDLYRMRYDIEKTIIFSDMKGSHAPPAEPGV